jgi:hypothetical protein
MQFSEDWIIFHQNLRVRVKSVHRDYILETLKAAELMSFPHGFKIFYRISIVVYNHKSRMKQMDNDVTLHQPYAFS